MKKNDKPKPPPSVMIAENSDERIPIEEPIMQEGRVQYGRFEVSEELIQGQNYLALFPIMSAMVPVEVRYHPDCGTYEYLGKSPLFDPIPYGHEAPWYSVSVTENAIGQYCAHAERIT